MTRFLLVLVLGLFVQNAMAQRFVKTFDTIDQMLAANPRDIHTNAITLGRTAVSDGGGGRFYYDANSSIATNRGTVFKPANANGRWLRAFDGGEINALWFGADPGNGVNTGADSTAAFRDAFWFAQKPTYGWAATSGQGYTAFSIYVPPGSYVTTGTLTNYGVEFYGKAAQRAGNYTSETVFHSKHNGRFMTFDYGGITSGTGSADYRVGAVDKIIVNGYAETYQTFKNITAVTDRLTFRVATGDLPTLDMGSFPEMNWCFFYSNEGQWLGAGQIASINGGTGDVTLVSGTDVYATVGGTVLRTVDKVVFSPMSAAGEGGLASFVDPAGAGPTAFWIQGSTGTVGIGPRLSNILINGFHVGIRVGPGILERRQQGLKFLKNKFADVLFPREFNSTDSPWEGFTYMNGYYRADYSRTYTNTITNPSLQNCTFGFFGLGPLERIEQLLSEAHSYAQLAVLRTLSQHIDYAFLDLCIRHGLIVYRGYNESAASSVYDSVLSFGNLQIRTPLVATGYQTPDPIHPTDRAAVYVPNSNIMLPVYLVVDQYSVQDGGAGDFQHAFDINATGANQVWIDEVMSRNGATTNWVKSGSSRPTIGQVSPNLRAAEVGTGFYSPAANQIAVTLNGTNALAITGSGTTFTTQTATPAITMTRADTGKTYSWLAGTDSVTWNNDSQSRAFLTVIADTTSATTVIGNSAANWAPRTSLISGEVASSAAGTDVAPSDLYLVAPRGTGANSTGGRIYFNTPNSLASGTTPQTTSTRLILKREGQLNFAPLASEPTLNLGAGDLFYKTGVGFRYYDGAAWNTIGAGGGGNVSLSGTPSAGQAAEWATSSTIQGVAVTGSGSYVKATSPTLTTPNLGVASGTSLALTGTAGGGFLSFPTQSSAPSTPASGFVEYADSTGRMAWKRASDGFVRTVNSTLTADRVYTWPDANTTLPIVSQQLTLSGPTAARTITLPDANFTAARTDAAQTFSGVQTFGGGAMYIGNAGSSSPYFFTFLGNDHTYNAAGLGLNIYNYAAGNNEYGVSFRGANVIATSGDSRAIHMARTFVPTSGTATWSQLSVQPTINQTGGANGITRGLFVNSVVTAAADHRALEVAGGKSFFTYTPLASEPAIWLNGTWFSLGSSTTTKPHLLIEPSGTTSTAWSTQGTGLGINAASSFTGNLIDAQKSATSRFRVSSVGDVTAGKYNNVTVTAGTGTPAVTVNGSATISGTNTGDQQIGGATGWRFYEEFNWNSAGSGGSGWLQTASGGENSMAASPAANRPGIFQMSTSSSTTGNPNLMDNGSSLFLGGGPLTMEWSARITTGLPSTADDYDVWMGLGDTQTSSSQTDGVYFLFDRGVSAVNWQFVTAKAGTRTTTDTGIAANGSGTWQKFRFEVNAAATSVVAYIDGVACATNTVNLPDTSSNLCGKMFGLLKQGGSTGTTAEILQLDYVFLSQDFTTSR